MQGWRTRLWRWRVALAAVCLLVGIALAGAVGPGRALFSSASAASVHLSEDRGCGDDSGRTSRGHHERESEGCPCPTQGYTGGSGRGRDCGDDRETGGES